MKTKLIVLYIFLGLSFISCEDWLKAESSTQISQDDMFSTDEGFHEALAGVYLGMCSTNLYGMHLTWHMLDYFAHYYALVSGSKDTYLHSHDYGHSQVAPYLTGAWNGLYNLIANCNNILEKLEEHKSELDPLNYQLVKGEALTLRAFFHFDLMRIFGYGNLRNRDVSGERAIPYVTKFSKETTPQLSYAETFKLLKQDLLEAIDLLWGEGGENCFRKTGDTGYFYQANGNSPSFFTSFTVQNCSRVDYYVAKAILARVYMWEGTDEGYAEAAKIAEEWILTGNNEEQDCWKWVERTRVTTTNLANRDRTFSQEHIWHLYVNKLYDIIGQWLDASNTSGANSDRTFLTKEVAFEIFEMGTGNNVGASDWRQSYLLKAQGAGNNNYATLKLDQNGGTGNYLNLIPLISTPEMYYICAEVYAEQGRLKEAIEYLNTVRRARGISADLPETLNKEEVKTEILKEYRKEFVSLGQLFYFYKRWGVENIVGYAQSMTDKEYVIPYPDSETSYR